MSRRVTVTVADEDAWLIEAIEEVVKVKRKGGLRSSFSFELVRLAKNGLTGNLTGHEIDQRILMGDKP